MGQVWELLAFREKLVQLKVRGSVIKAALENGVSDSKGQT
jgi:hypothetical protein